MLGIKQERFVSEYLVDLNGQQAAIRSGYSPASAKVQASRLLTNDNVRYLIQRKQRETEQRLQLQREDVIRGLVLAAKTAKQQRDPASMITAYREIGRMLGYYHQHQVSDKNNDGLSETEIMKMSEKELLKMSGAKRLSISVDSADEWLVT